MNPQKNCGGSAGDQVKEQTVSGHVIRDPRILTEDASNTSFQQQHHGFIPRQMNFGASTSSDVYYPFVVPLAAPRVLTVSINYGLPYHLLSSYNNMPVYRGSSEDFARNRSSCNSESAETSVGSSHRYPHESTSTWVNVPIDTWHLYYGHHPQYAGGNGFLPIANYNNERIRSGAAGRNPIHLGNYNGFARGVHGAEPFQPAIVFHLHQMVDGNYLLGQMGFLAWDHFPATPFIHGHGDGNLHQLPQTQGMRGHCLQFYPVAPAPYFPPSGAISMHMSRPVGTRPSGSSRQRRIRPNQPGPKESMGNQLRTRRYESRSLDGEADRCIICLCDYQDQEELGCLDCGHDYHANCLKKWIRVRNVCPICKSEALPSRR